MTKFEEAVQAVREKKINAPVVSMSGGGTVDYFQYQLATHKFYLSMMAKKISNRHIKLKDLKEYYGLKGKTAKDCLPQLLEIIDNYNK